MRWVVIGLALLLLIAPAIAKMPWEKVMNKPMKLNETPNAKHPQMSWEKVTHEPMKTNPPKPALLNKNLSNMKPNVMPNVEHPHPEIKHHYAKPEIARMPMKNWQERVKRLHEIEEKRNEIRERIKERINSIEKRMQEMKHKERIREQDMAKRLEKYREFRAKFLKMGLNGEGFVYAKQFVVHGAYACVDFMNLLKLNIENSNLPNETKEMVLANITNYINELNEKIQAVNNSNTPEELRNATKELRTVWNEIKPKIRIYAQLVLISKLKNVADKAEMIGMRIEGDLSVIKEKGINTTKIENLLDEYTTHIEKAKEYISIAAEKAGNEEIAISYINNARKELHEAFNILRQVYMEVLKVKPKLFMGNNTGELWVDMNGNADVEGHGIVAVRGNLTINVTPKSGVVAVVGLEKLSETNNSVTYSGNGKIIIRGNVTLNVSGDFRMFAKGVANVYLNGTGIYRIKPLPKEKMAEFTLNGNETLTIGK